MRNLDMWSSSFLRETTWVGVGSPAGEFSARSRDPDPERRLAPASPARRALLVNGRARYNKSLHPMR